jgi:hypothetical protein
MDVCRSEYPPLYRVSPERVVACHLYDSRAADASAADVSPGAQ